MIEGTKKVTIYVCDSKIEIVSELIERLLNKVFLRVYVKKIEDVKEVD
ncbi:MAG: hypothetical protein ACTSWG_03155 [Candidatus Helarchaeota archaeon]